MVYNIQIYMSVLHTHTQMYTSMYVYIHILPNCLLRGPGISDIPIAMSISGVHVSVFKYDSLLKGIKAS